jgi:hypothetical protein
MDSGSKPKSRRNQGPIVAPAGRKPNSIPTTMVLDVESKYMLRELAGSKSHGAFVSGLIRSEFARQAERRRLRNLLEGD